MELTKCHVNYQVSILLLACQDLGIKISVLNTKLQEAHKGGRTLFWPLFDLIRHGLAHQYQQIIVDLDDSKHFYISLTGTDYGRYLVVAANLQRPREHLGYTFDKDGDLELKIYPDILFLDFEHAINKSGLLLNKGLSFQYLSRPKSKGKPKSKMSDNYYDFNTIQLEKSLRADNHFRF
jgi:hypothetical protein